jgi:hypothetical protein
MLNLGKLCDVYECGFADPWYVTVFAIFQIWSIDTHLR